MTTSRQVAVNARRVLDRCREAAVRSGRHEGAVTLVAVTKTHSRDLALAAAEAGVRDFGENQVQEAESKWLDSDRGQIRLHLIGRLQRNKARRAVRLFDLIHSCDSPALARRLSDLSVAGDPATSKCVPLLLEVNVSGEVTKAGFSPEDLQSQVRELLALPGLEVHGLMTVAPVVADPELARPHFSELRRLSEQLRSRHSSLGPELSMGMSDDYEIAIEEGATIVRVGRAIYRTDEL